MEFTRTSSSLEGEAPLDNSVLSSVVCISREDGPEAPDATGGKSTECT